MKTFKLFLVISLFCVTYITQAQDVIVKKDNSTILSKVIVINGSEIIYKKWSNLDGPEYSINCSEIICINYQNGEIDRFDDNSVNQVITLLDEQNDQIINFMERKGNKLTLNGRILSDEEVHTLVGEASFKTYMSAKSQIDSGRASTIMFVLSVGTAICLATDAYLNYKPEKMIPVFVFAGLADVSLVFTCVLGGTGKGRMNWVANEYNKKTNGYSLNLSPSIMASKTPQLQNTYSLGLTFSMNF